MRMNLQKSIEATILNNMSHDIRTPMNAIIGFTSLAATHIDEKERLKVGKLKLKKVHVVFL